MINYTLDKNKRGVDVSKELYGLFFEDINQAADGGMNAEMVINNSFEFEYFTYDDYNAESPVDVRKAKLTHWDIYGAGPMRVCDWGGIAPTNPSYVALNVGGQYHMENPGFHTSGAFDRFGMPVDAGMTYHFSMFVKHMGYNGNVRVWLKSSTAPISEVGEIIVENNGKDWEKVSCSFKANVSEMARLVIEFNGNGRIGVDMVSLIPSDTWGDPDVYRNGKFSAKMVNVLKECHPSFFRFPGGCVVEGDVDFEHQYRWRNTVGPLETRKQICNVWRYMQSYGIGFYEYFCLCEDLHMAPLPVLHCGLICQIRMGEQRKTAYQRIMPGTTQFKIEVIDNVADLIFFALGDVDSEDEEEARWARVRADMGHPGKFDLRFIGIGNENWGLEYFDNLHSCLLGLRAYKYKGKQTDLLKLFNITVVTTAGVDIRPSDTNPSWATINQKYRDMIVDEHVYNSYQWFIDNTKRYDCYDRTGAKVFMGEYSMHTEADGRGRLNGENNLKAALAEAAFLTGCERNSDVVKMTCYAPLWASTSNYRWTPNMIWFNARDIMRTPSYFVQQMYASNIGSYTLTDVGQVNDSNAGGILIGGHRTASAVKEVRVKDIASGEIIYRHNFKDGIGGWKDYPNSIGIHIENGELIIPVNDAFNGVYFDDQQFENCEVEVDFRRLNGEQSFIVGVGVADVRNAETVDNAGFSISCQYGKNHKGYDVSFDKRVDFMRTVCEMMGKDKFFGYDAEGNTMKLVYTTKTLTAYIYKGGEWHEILFKHVWKVNERIFNSATVGEDGKIYFKVVNISGKDEIMHVDLRNFGEKKKVTVTKLYNEDPNVINEISPKSGMRENCVPTQECFSIKGDEFGYILKDNSVNVLVIE